MLILTSLSLMWKSALVQSTPWQEWINGFIIIILATRSPKESLVNSRKRGNKLLSKAINNSRPVAPSTKVSYSSMRFIQLKATKISHGWIPKGEHKPIQTTGSRSRLNLVGALSLSDIAATFVASYEKVNTQSMVDFFLKLKRTLSSHSHVAYHSWWCRLSSKWISPN